MASSFAHFVVHICYHALLDIDYGDDRCCSSQYSVTVVDKEWLLHIYVVLLFAFAGIMYWLLTKDLIEGILLPQPLLP